MGCRWQFGDWFRATKFVTGLLEVESRAKAKYAIQMAPWYGFGPMEVLLYKHYCRDMTLG